MRAPGALSLGALEQMQRALAVTQGNHGTWIDPAFHRCIPNTGKQFWMGRQPVPCPGSLQTLAYIVDLLLQGKVASAVDVATQRMKSLEQIASGGHYKIAQRQELCPQELQSMSSTTETLEGCIFLILH